MAPRLRSSWKTLTLVLVGALLVGALALGIVLLVRTAGFTSRQVQVVPADPIALDEQAAAGRLAGAIRFPTVSFANPGREDDAAFQGLLRHLRETFPRAHAELGLQVFGGASLLFTWGGSDPALAPVLLTAHLDVVPAEGVPVEAEPPAVEMLQGIARSLLPPEQDHSPFPRTTPEGGLESNRPDDGGHDPFAGDIADGFIWGRGTLDDKIGVVGLLQAVELLLERGFRPRRTILLGFGRDEEVGGARGARLLAGELQRRGIRPALVLDEGTPILADALPGLAAPVALVGVAEKGYVSLELVATAAGGHSSSPPERTAIGLLSRAINRLEENPRPSRLDGVALRFFEYVGPEMAFSRRLIFANLWLTRPLALRTLAGAPQTSPLVRTTTAATIIAGGERENVLPTTARAVVNFRLLPGDTAEGLLADIRALVGSEDLAVRYVNRAEALDPSPVSESAGPPFRAIERTIREVFPGAIVAPFLVTAGTDARFYGHLTDSIYRFLPVTLTHEDVTRIHGVGERVSVAGYAQAVRFYYQLIRNTQDLGP